jgi:hypothetical protein
MWRLLTFLGHIWVFLPFNVHKISPSQAIILQNGQVQACSKAAWLCYASVVHNTVSLWLAEASWTVDYKCLRNKKINFSFLLFSYGVMLASICLKCLLCRRYWEDVRGCPVAFKNSATIPAFDPPHLVQATLCISQHQVLTLFEELFYNYVHP